MEKALDQARAARKLGEVPVGAVAVLDGLLVAAGHNLSIKNSDPAAHAEIVCLRRAARRLKNYRLTGIIIYITVEPCVMCAGAMVWSRVKKAVYGCADAKAGACGSVLNIPAERKLNHRFETEGGVRAEECRKLLQDFFRRKRK